MRRENKEPPVQTADGSHSGYAFIVESRRIEPLGGKAYAAKTIRVLRYAQGGGEDVPLNFSEHYATSHNEALGLAIIAVKKHIDALIAADSAAEGNRETE